MPVLAISAKIHFIIRIIRRLPIGFQSIKTVHKWNSMEPNDIEIIEILQLKKVEGSVCKNLKQQLFQDDEFKILFEDTEILIAAIRITAQKTTVQGKISNIMNSWH